MPCPKSHFPVYAVTLPSDATASHESSFSGSIWDWCVSKGPCAVANGSIKAAVLKQTTSAPEALTKSRREISFFIRAPSDSAGWRASYAYAQNSGTTHSTSLRESARRWPLDVHRAALLP